MKHPFELTVPGAGYEPAAQAGTVHDGHVGVGGGGNGGVVVGVIGGVVVGVIGGVVVGVRGGVVVAVGGVVVATGGVAVTSTTTDEYVCEFLPEQVSPYVAVLVGVTTLLPLLALEPLHAPLATHEYTFFELQKSVVDPPEVTDGGVA